MSDLVGFPENRFSIYEMMAKESFKFLTEKYGFRLAKVEKVEGKYIVLHYLSETVFLNLFYGSPSYELDFSFGRIGKSGKPKNESFSSSDLASVCYGEDRGYRLFSANSYENLLKCVPKLADLLKGYGGGFLEGNSQSYEKILFETKQKLNKWYNEQELKQARKDASVAWENKEYFKVINIFESIFNDLSPSEKKKLEYSRKHQKE